MDHFIETSHPMRQVNRLRCLALSHRSAAPALRQRFVLDHPTRTRVTRSIRQACGDSVEVLTLSTCNRTELYLAGEPGVTDVALRVLAEDLGLRPSEVTQMTEITGLDAATHLCRVAAGLESVVLGEDQIVQQLKQAFAEAVDTGAMGPCLHAVFHLAFRVARRARTETAISHGRVSVSSAGVEHAARCFGGSLTGRHVVVIGAGSVGHRTVRHLAGHAVASLRVVNRGAVRGKELAELACSLGLPARHAAMSELDELVGQADLLISGISGGRVLDAGPFKARSGRRTVVVDLGMPPNVDPAVGELRGVTCVSLDELDHATTASRTQRERAVRDVEAILNEETGILTDPAPAIRDGVLGALYRRCADVSRCEVVRQAAHGLPVTEAELNAFAGRLVRKFLAPVSGRVTQQPNDGDDGVDHLSALVDLFELRPTADA